jgi:hypothetical protein
MSKRSARQIVFAFLDAHPGGVITGWELFDYVRPRTGRLTYPSTLIGYARDYASIAGASFDCVDPIHSKYNYRRGCGLADAILD